MFCLYIYYLSSPLSFAATSTKGAQLIVAATFHARPLHIPSKLLSRCLNSTQIAANQLEAAISSSITTKTAKPNYISTYNGCDMIVIELSIASKLVTNATTQSQTSQIRLQSLKSRHECLKSTQISL